MDPVTVPRLWFGAQPAILEGHADAVLPVVRDDFVTLQAPFLVLRGQCEREMLNSTIPFTCQASQTLPSLHLW